MKLTEQERDKIYEESQQAASRLLEAGCDSVVILATCPAPDGDTGFFHTTRGNTFAATANAAFYVQGIEHNRIMQGCDDEAG